MTVAQPTGGGTIDGGEVVSDCGGRKRGKGIQLSGRLREVDEFEKKRFRVE